MTPEPRPIRCPLALAAGARLCSPFIAALHVNGASITMFGLRGNQSTIGATDPVAARAETLQFELGEGPHWEALRTGLPVLCPNLLTSKHQSWPMFSNVAHKLGIAAVFAFPMKLGAATVGVVDLHCLTPRRLDAHQVSLASSMAHRIATAAVHLATRSANNALSAEREMAPALRREVHQATGMVQSQLDTTATDAFAQLRGHAFTSGQPVEDAARDVVSGRLDFSTLRE